MKSLLLLIACFSVSIISLKAQSKWGIEVKGSRFNTTNSGKLEGGYYGEGYYVILNESDLLTYSQSLGVIYQLNERNLLKLHLGTHQNGILLSLNSCTDTGCDLSENVQNAYHYFQIAPSYAYRVLNKRIMIPVEAGININFQTGHDRNEFVPINSVNLDYEFSIGLDYRLDPDFILGIHGLFTGNINSYQDSNIEFGTFLPKSLGLEFSIIYEFGKSIEEETE